jgi:hypothetical protein
VALAAVRVVAPLARAALAGLRFSGRLPAAAEREARRLLLPLAAELPILEVAVAELVPIRLTGPVLLAEGPVVAVVVARLHLELPVLVGQAVTALPASRLGKRRHK